MRREALFFAGKLEVNAAHGRWNCRNNSCALDVQIAMRTEVFSSVKTNSRAPSKVAKVWLARMASKA